MKSKSHETKSAIYLSSVISISPFNTTEIDLVIKYLEKLFSGDIIKRKINQSDVGIISPYRKQCEKLTEKCHQLKWTDIQIGSVETFQGQERPIIVVSTVRSRMRNIGFLDNAKVSEKIGILNINELISS